jgi:hypothetical protein
LYGGYLTHCLSFFRFVQFGQNWQPIGTQKQDARRSLRDQGGWKESPMTEIDDATTPFVEAEMKEHHAALIRQMVAVGIIICATLIWLGLHHWAKENHGNSFVSYGLSE